jgi:hypothetical protein
VCTDLGDLNKACPKDNYPMPLIDQMNNECVTNEIFSFMDVFSNYNQIEIQLEYQQNIAFIYPWGMFSYRKMLFGIKNNGVTFQRAMLYDFHEIKHIIFSYRRDYVKATSRW